MALVKLRSYRDPIDAQLTRARLESSGIRAAILDQHLASIQWLYSNAIGGVKVLVEEADLQAAQEALLERGDADLLSQPSDQAPLANGDGCPTCGSSAVRPSRVHRNAAAISLLTGLPLIAWRRSWVCAGCGHSWKRDTTAKFEPSEETIRAEQLVHEKRPYPVIRAIFATLLGLSILYYVQYKIRQPS